MIGYFSGALVGSICVLFKVVVSLTNLSQIHLMSLITYLKLSTEQANSVLVRPLN